MNEPDAYEVCAFVRHYYRKNGYLPTVEMLGVTREYLDQLVENGIVNIIPLYEGGPPTKVVLTEKGATMADKKAERRR
jgi:sulfur relay (sulfurtransferase) DsrC/TusE family protein